MKNGPYILVVAPDGYPGKLYRDRYAYEHHVVWWKHTGETLSDGFLIHHKNEDKHDNRLENLELKSRSSHTAEHQPKAEMATLTCEWCHKPFDREARDVRTKIKLGQTRFYCCKSHQVHDQQRRKNIPQ